MPYLCIITSHNARSQPPVLSIHNSFIHQVSWSLIFPLTHSLFHSSSLSVIHLITHLFLQSTNQSIDQFITKSHSFSFIMLLGSRDQENGKTGKQTGLMSFTQILNMKYYKMVFPWCLHCTFHHKTKHSFKMKTNLTKLWLVHEIAVLTQNKCNQSQTFRIFITRVFLLLHATNYNITHYNIW